MSRSTIDRLNREIANIRYKIADETRREADATTKINRAADKARRATSDGSRRFALAEVERAERDLETARARRAQYERTIANKAADLQREHASLARAEEQERKKQQAIQKRAEAVQEKRIRDLEAEIRAHRKLRTALPQSSPGTGTEDYDCFIAHASEDKEGFVRLLARALEERDITLFYDELSIEWGDSLRQRIDAGLSRSKFGVVVLSEAFFRKEWPKRELDGLVQMEIRGQSKILPICHKVTKDEVASFSPMLADKLALNTSEFTVAEIAEKLAKLSRA